MVERWLAVAVFFLLVEPLLVLAHELGHAAVPLARGYSATVVLGGRNGRRASLGRCSFVVEPRKLLRLVTFGRAEYGSATDRQTVLLATVAGPAVTIAAIWPALAAASETTGFVGHVLDPAVTYLFVQALVTLVPIEYPSFMGQYAGRESDGLTALQLFRERDG